MNWFDEFAENLKIFWNQPVPIIGFTIGMLIIGALFILAKTSIGKKALNKLKNLYADLKARIEIALEVFRQMKKEFEEYKQLKEEEIATLSKNYEIKLNQYKERMVKQDELLKVICENSPNIKIKEAYKNYNPVQLDLPVNEVVENIKEEVRAEYDYRLAKVEKYIYGKAEETKND